MADVKSATFGFELLQELYDTQIVKKEDVIILFLHWYFIKHGFRCIGLGDSKTFDASDRGSELFPAGWNNDINYALRYINDGKLYILHGIKSDEDLLLNLLRAGEQNVSNIVVPVEQTVNNLHGPLESLIPTYQNLLSTVRTDLIDPIVPGNTTETTTQTTSSRERDVSIDPDFDPLRVRQPTQPSPRIHPRDPEADPRNVGVRDLDPFSRGGGGMLYDPFSRGPRNPLDPLRPGLGVPGILPPGAVPPHARFDPFGPPDINPQRPRNQPDADHLPPPGYDDMFM